MAKWSDEKVADLTRRLADTAIDYKQRCEVLEERLEAAQRDAKEAEAYAEELEAKLAMAVEALRQIADPISLAQGNVNAEIAHATLAALKKQNNGEQ